MNHYRLNSEQAMPKISIIIPTYNYGRFIRKALNSLLHQTFQDFEIIVVDDGSTDNTKDIIDTIFKENIRYFFSKKKGAASARNLGLRHATGKYVAFLDADDWLLPDSLELRIKFLKNHPEYDWVYGNWQIVDENGSYLGTADQFHLPPPEKRMGNLFPVLLSGANFIQTMSPLIKRKDLLSVGGFRTGLKASQDYELWLRLSRGRNVGYIDAPIGVQRIHKSHISAFPEKRYLTEIQIINEYMGDPVASKILSPLYSNRISNVYNYLALIFALSNHKAKAVKSCLKSLWVKPMQRTAYRLLQNILFENFDGMKEAIENKTMLLYDRPCVSGNIKKSDRQR